MNKRSINVDRIVALIFILLLSASTVGLVYKSGFQAAQAWEGTSNTLSPGFIEGTAGNFTEIYLDSENVTELLAYPQEPYTYLIYYDGSNYRAIFGNRTVAFTTSDLEDAIESADGNCSSGGIIVLYGPGETWTVTSQIDAQNENVTIKSDWSLTLRAVDALNDEMFYNLDIDNYQYLGLHLDGNNDTMSVVATHGIHTNRADNIKVKDCWIHDVRQFGIWINGVSSNIAYGGEVRGNLLENCSWNGIQIGAYARYLVVDGNDVDGFSDVGITVMGWFNTISNNKVRNGNMPGGSAGGGYGYGAESYGLNATFNKYTGNIAEDCVHGMVFTTNAEFNEWTDGIIVNEDVSVGAWGKMVWMQGNKNKVADTLFVDLSGSTQDYGAELSGDYNEISNCRFVNILRAIRTTPTGNYSRVLRNTYFENVTVGLFIDGGQTWVDGNDFDLATTDVTDNEATTAYGYNRDQSGNWDEGVEP